MSNVNDVMEIAKAFMTPGNRESSPGELAAAYIDLHERMVRIRAGCELLALTDFSDSNLVMRKVTRILALTKEPPRGRKTRS